MPLVMGSLPVAPVGAVAHIDLGNARGRGCGAQRIGDEGRGFTPTPERLCAPVQCCDLLARGRSVRSGVHGVPEARAACAGRGVARAPVHAAAKRGVTERTA